MRTFLTFKFFSFLLSVHLQIYSKKYKFFSLSSFSFDLIECFQAIYRWRKNRKEKQFTMPNSALLFFLKFSFCLYQIPHRLNRKIKKNAWTTNFKYYLFAFSMLFCWKSFKINEYWRRKRRRSGKNEKLLLTWNVVCLNAK